MSTLPEQVEVDFLQLADRAEVLEGKLYMMGGAWDRLHTDAEATLTMGHPLTATRGQCFRAMTVLNLQLVLPRFGAYRIVASVAGQSEGQATFYALDASQVPA